MERQVNVVQNQKLPSSELLRVQDFAREAVDHVVRDAIVSGRAFTGMGVSEDGPTGVTVDAGRLWLGGPVHTYAGDALDLFSLKAAQHMTKVAIVAWGADVSTDIATRTIMTNTETRQTTEQQVATTRLRNVSVQALGGADDPNPQLPAISSSVLLIAVVTMDTAGIVSIEMQEQHRLPNLADIENRTEALEAFRNDYEPIISGIASDVASIAGSEPVVSADQFSGALREIARLREQVNLPDSYTGSGSDSFLTADESNLSDLDSLVRVEEGVRFPYANDSGHLPVDLANANDPKATIVGNILLPKWSGVTRLAVPGKDGSVAVSAYETQETTFKRKVISRTVTSLGAPHLACTNSRAWWSDVTWYNQTTFARHGEVFVVLGENVRAGKHNQPKFTRYAKLKKDTITDTYWYPVENTITITGTITAQDFVAPATGWLVDIPLYFSSLGRIGPVNVLLTKTLSNGDPDVNAVIGEAVLDVEDLKLYPHKTSVPITPVFTEIGERYAIVIVTTGDHRLVTAPGAKYTAGALRQGVAGSFLQGDLTKDLKFNLVYAQFERGNVVLNLKACNLDGGIGGIEIIAGQVVPDGTSLVYEINPGDGWVSIDQAAADAAVFANLPAIVDVRVTMLGSTDLMPGVNLDDATIRLMRSANVFKHFSTERLLAAPTSTVEVRWLLEGWNEARHTFDCALRIGGAIEAWDSMEEITLKDEPDIEGRIERVFTFNLDAPTDRYEIVVDGTTTTPLDLFHGARRDDVAL
ncbi:hypothetical protein GGD81_001384 [Rhodobium orientis]|uniref:DUF4815 domain-containing protein n=1 Tax=Rhodobium orientis TaxID=34017 RepID=A0A327JKJ3_9HYPH|nr:hypothetical protein [Rhodobium orientis]MBB4302357.1 hypothetical protein [Rhodobium orientis]MBK5949062.1 hypothetical protein [Rhodobium orientis]RAI26611.1 hypothetical protein CH339_13500 [Rhodobium orientis]